MPRFFGPRSGTTAAPGVVDSIERTEFVRREHLGTAGPISTLPDEAAIARWRADYPMPATLAEPGTHDLTETEQIEPNRRGAEDDTDSDPAVSPGTASEVVKPPNAEAGFRDPGELVIGENIRQGFDLGQHPKQAASIRAFGIQAPVLVERETDGSLHVLDGQVRNLIAVAEGVGHGAGVDHRLRHQHRHR